jgi:hypothetical protein
MNLLISVAAASVTFNTTPGAAGAPVVSGVAVVADIIELPSTLSIADC